MALKPEAILWLKLFKKVVTGRATIEECNELGVSEETRKELYNARYSRRQDSFRKVDQKFEFSTRWSEEPPDSPEDALIELIDLKNGKQ